MNNLDGMTTYRVYAQLANSDDVLGALIGDSEHPGFFSTTTNFFQHNIGGVTPSGINPAFLAPFHLLLSIAGLLLALSMHQALEKVQLAFLKKVANHG